MKEIQVKLFGGAQVLRDSRDVMSIGAKNVLTAKQLLKNNGINILVENTGKDFGRIVYLYSDTGVVLLKKIPKSQAYR